MKWPYSMGETLVVYFVIAAWLSAVAYLIGGIRLFFLFMLGWGVICMVVVMAMVCYAACGDG